MWKNLEIVYKRKIPAAINIAAITVVALFWILALRAIPGFYPILNILPSVMIIGFAFITSINFESYKETIRTVTELKQEIKKSDLVRNEIGCLSDVGKVRKIDEDSVFVAKAFSTIDGKSTQNILLIVADGMGGHSKGEVASAMGVTTVTREVIPKMFLNQKDTDYRNILASAITEANKNILNHAMDHSECEGMGTTMTTTIINQNIVHVGHVGDTRAYIYLDGKIKQLTKDHSLVQELVDKGEISQKEAKHHPQKNVITRVVGVYSEINSDVYDYTWDKNEQILMCCDGLVNHVEDEEIAGIIQSSYTTKQASEDLIKLANDRGGKDNISVILTPSLSLLFKNENQGTDSKTKR